MNAPTVETELIDALHASQRRDAEKVESGASASAAIYPDLRKENRGFEPCPIPAALICALVAE